MLCCHLDWETKSTKTKVSGFIWCLCSLMQRETVKNYVRWVWKTKTVLFAHSGLFFKGVHLLTSSLLAAHIIDFNRMWSWTSAIITLAFLSIRSLSDFRFSNLKSKHKLSKIDSIALDFSTHSFQVLHIIIPIGFTYNLFIFNQLHIHLWHLFFHVCYVLSVFLPVFCHRR